MIYNRNMVPGNKTFHIQWQAPAGKDKLSLLITQFLEIQNVLKSF